MHTHLLPAGTILDERYRIDAVLGEGGFGVTYAAENLRLGLRVAIKELYWRGHSVRDVSQSLHVGHADEQDVPTFQAHKERFLREARTIRDFSNLPGMVRVMDYFEANTTAYIVMEYVEGETLAAYLNRRTRIPAEEAFACFLPLVDSLGKVHAGGVIHRDISPDNIIVRPDGSLVLLDFGAARAYRTMGESKYTTIAKDSYAPGEQYDKNGRQGPWTDVYALCATLYTCVAGVPPLGAVQRMFLDELKKPSELGIEISAPCEEVVMKGLEMTASKRHGSMDELSQAMRATLPQPKEPRSRGRNVLAGILAGLVCALVVLGIWFWQQNRAVNRFRGIETETFYLIAPENMTAAEFAGIQDELSARLEAFAGKDNYLLSVEGDRLRAELPLDCFAGQEIYSVLKAEFMSLVNGKRYNMEYELKADWEDPTSSLTPGSNQVLPSELVGETAMFSYSWSEGLTLGQRANLLMDIKVRLDALGTPYAFGTLYGDANAIAIRISPERLNQFILDSLGSRDYVLDIAGDFNGNRISFSRSGYAAEPEVQTVRYPDGSFGISCRMNSSYRQEQLVKLADDLRRCGEDALYLQSGNGCALAEIPLADVGDGEEIVFKTFRFEGLDALEAENKWVADYVDALVNQTDLPAICTLDEVRMLDAQGETLLGESIWDHYGLRILEKACNTALLEQIKEYTQDHGYSSRAGDTHIQILLNLDVDEDLVEDFSSAVEELLNDYGLKDMVVNPTVEIRGIDTEPGESYSVTLNTTWFYDREHWVNDMNCWITTEGRLAPYTDEFIAWWEALSEESLGVTTD